MLIIITHTYLLKDQGLVKLFLLISRKSPRLFIAIKSLQINKEIIFLSLLLIQPICIIGNINLKDQMLLNFSWREPPPEASGGWESTHWSKKFKYKIKKALIYDLMTKIIEDTNPVFTNLKCCKVSFLIKIKYYYSSHYNDILSYILITIESSTSKKNITKQDW